MVLLPLCNPQTAGPILDELDKYGAVAFRLYRDATRYQDNVHMKVLFSRAAQPSLSIIITFGKVFSCVLSLRTTIKPDSPFVMAFLRVHPPRRASHGRPSAHQRRDVSSLRTETPRACYDYARKLTQSHTHTHHTHTHHTPLSPFQDLTNLNWPMNRVVLLLSLIHI